METRVLEDELMDDPGLEPVAHHAALDGLARLHAWSGSSGLLWGALQPFFEGTGPEPLRVLDIATGGGDLPCGLLRRARRRGVNLVVDGCDLSGRAVNRAKELGRKHGLRTRFFVLDLQREDLPADYDVIVCTLFLHHLSDADAVELMRRMGQAARRGIVVQDLDRSTFGLRLTQLASRFLARSEVVRVDGERSVRAAFRPLEARAMARQAGLVDAQVERVWPARWLLTWNRPGAQSTA